LYQDWQQRYDALAAQAPDQGSYGQVFMDVLKYLLNRYRDDPAAQRPAFTPGGRASVTLRTRSILVMERLYPASEGRSRQPEWAQARAARFAKRMKELGVHEATGTPGAGNPSEWDSSARGEPLIEMEGAKPRDEYWRSVLEVLASADGERRLAGLRTLVHRGTLNEVGLLLDLLALPQQADEHPEERAHIAEALDAVIHAQRTEPGACLPLRQADWRKRLAEAHGTDGFPWRAAEAQATLFGMLTAHPKLNGITRFPFRKVYETRAEALASHRLGRYPVYAKACANAESPWYPQNDDDREQWALIEKKTPSLEELCQVLCPEAWRFSYLPESTVRTLFDAFTDDRTRPACFEILARCRNPSVLRLAVAGWTRLAKALNLSNEMRSYAALIRQDFRPTYVQDELRGALLSSNAEERYRGIGHLGWLGRLDDVGLLADLLNVPPSADEHPKERERLIESMKRIARAALYPYVPIGSAAHAKRA